MKLLPPPGPERRQQLTRLALLAVLLVAVLLFWGIPTGSPPAGRSPAARGASTDRSVLPVPEAVKLTSLETVSPLRESVRNPFVFGQQQAPSLPGSSFVSIPQPGFVPPAVPPPPPVPQGPPPIPLRLTGMTVPVAGGRTLVTLKDSATEALYQAYEGDIVDGRYRVVKVGVQSVVVSYVDGSGMRTLALGS